MFGPSVHRHRVISQHITCKVKHALVFFLGMFVSSGYLGWI